MASPATRHLLLRTRTSFQAISTTADLLQEPQLGELTPTPQPPLDPEAATPLPPNPSSCSPLFFSSTWRSPIPPSSLSPSSSFIPRLALFNNSRIQSLSQSLDVASLMNVFADWITSQRWLDIKQLFEFWVRTLDLSGKPNRPDSNVYNHYLRANLMTGASVGEMLDHVAQMEEYSIEPNTASFNLVLKAMHQAGETEAAQKLLERMLQTGKESQPDEESYDLVVGMLFQAEQMDAALKYVDVTLKSGYMLSMKVFSDCVQSCAKQGRLDTLVSVIERCRAMDQNKALCPPWRLCNFIAEVALQDDNCKLAFYALEFIVKWIARGEIARPAIVLSVDEGLVLSALGTAGRTFNSTLLDASWAILKRSLRQTKPSPESYLGKIYALASMGHLQKSFSALHEFETTYAIGHDQAHDLFSPFTSLYPLVIACSKNGFETLDNVYFQLENLSRADPPYKSVSALNCVIVGCANIWDLDRAYQTFEAISGTFGLTPDVHSYNALVYAFGKVKKTFEASRVFEHLISVGVKPNAMSYSLLVDVHLSNRDQKAALAVIEEMVKAGFVPTKDTLKKVRRRCTREMDYESDDRVDAFIRKFKIRIGPETRRDMLFNLEYATEYA